MKGGSLIPCQFVFLLGLAVLRFRFCVGYAQSVDVEEIAHSIGAKIHEFSVRSTGSTAVKKELEMLGLTARDNNGTRVVKEVSEKMHSYFNKKIDSLRNLVAKIEEVQDTYKYDENIEPFDYLDVKDPASLAQHNLTYNPVFQLNISYKISGIHVPTDIYEKAPEILNVIKWTEALDEVFRNNTKDDDSLKWQHFGSETGVLRTYPGASFDVGPKGIDLYDVRKRPWYIHGSASPKSVVIIVDSSGSMYGRPLLIARLAVSELIDTFSENDFFNVIWFNIEVNYLACGKKFVQATSQNREYYKNKLKEIEASYVASWPKAYEAAFKMFEPKDVGAGCQKVMAVFTDGPTERAEGVFETYNSKKEVRVFTYAVGPPAHSVEALRSIACDNRGFFYRIPGVGSVRDVVKGYVTVLSRPMAKEKEHKPVWSSVYVDSGPLGMMITGTLPAFGRTNKTGGREILGVVGTDVTLKDIDEMSSSLLTSLGDDGYLFVISNNGHVIKHPAFETHRGYLPDPPDVYISDIEYTWDVNSTSPDKLRKNMLDTKEGEVGTMTFDAAMFSSDELKLRVTKRNMKYCYTKIKDAPVWAGIAFPSKTVEIVPGDPKIMETVIKYLLDYWQKNVPGDVETFVKMYDGSFNISKPDSVFTPEKKIIGRVDNYPNDITILTVPYNSGKGSAEDVKVTGYRKMATNVSGTFVTVGVVGFTMNHSQFQNDFFTDASVQGISQLCNATDDKEESYYCYLLDENAFVVAASVDSERVTGQFFGSVNSKVMKQLTEGDTLIYERIVKTDPQGSCLDPSSGSGSSAPFLRPFFSGTSYIKWCFAKAVWFVANLNVYNWIYGSPMAVSAEATEIEKPANRTCIMKMTAYYSEVNNENTTKQGYANCDVSCNSNSCRRSFVISKVPKTNLYFVFVDGLCPSSGQSYSDGVPGVHQEEMISDAEKEESVCFKDPHRKTIPRCYKSDDPESNYPCGRSSVISVSIFLFILTLLSSFCLLHL
ncbi:voltage-dependent calcium channel subunit alpha-2/delta-2-like [Dendronephthya gigantea]|uniref:voltage-dependent calcium channel subunit alpha-2/delta-2-like n=1 Tax=Dendronephthya gigantea TaxID=151771 RepID=UPI00106B2368|nr:voltage-dependent calcium channel subunit alpha-2/delta-2-like [Dendronephthya gigantea]